MYFLPVLSISKDSFELNSSSRSGVSDIVLNVLLILIKSKRSIPAEITEILVNRLRCRDCQGIRIDSQKNLVRGLKVIDGDNLCTDTQCIMRR